MASTNYLKAGGTFKFIDTAEDDVYYYPAKNCEMIEVTDNATVILTFSQSGDNAVQAATLTCTATYSDEVAAIMAEYIMTSGSAVGGSAGLTTIKTTTNPTINLTGISTAKAL